MHAKKFILVGGYPHKAQDGGRAFCENLTDSFEEPVKILECLFARPEENWPKAFSQDQEVFTKHLGDKKLEFKLATPDTFLEDIAWCNALYFRGGDIDLTSVLSQYPDWQKKLQGKVVAGSSMGAYMLSTYYIDMVTNTVEKGSGITNTKVVVHWNSKEYPTTKWEEGYEELRRTGEDLPTYKLAEGEFVEVTE